MPTDMTVANTILAQLGGGRFRVTTGAKTFTGGENFLSFRLPSGNFCKNGINYVKIVLNAEDTYDMTFLRLRGVQVKTIGECKSIYADQLQPQFTQHTGLQTSLGTMRVPAGFNNRHED